MNWDLKIYYKDKKSFDTDFDFVSKNLSKLASFEDKLKKDITTLEEFVSLNEQATIKVTKLYGFASKQSDLDLSNNDNSATLMRVQKLYNDLMSATSWFSPVVISHGKEAIDKEVSKSEKLKEYDFDFKVIFDQQSTILSEKEESVISKFGLSTSLQGQLYKNLMTADEQPTKVTLTDGTEVELSQMNYMKNLTTLRNQEDRKIIFESYYEKYEQHKNTIASIYNYVLQRDTAIANIRNEKSYLDLVLKKQAIPRKVYEGLVTSARNNAKTLIEYCDIRKQALGLKVHNRFDRTQSLASTTKKFDYKTSLDLCLKAAEQINDEELLNTFKEVSKAGLIDVAPRKGKRSGAYSSSTMDKEVPTMILLNHNDTLESMMTLMHEMGHSVHSTLSKKYQPTAKAGYEIYVAEAASVFAEFILYDYLSNQEMDKDTKIVMLQNLADKISSTFYRQTMFADYELEAHTKAEQGHPITESVLSDIMIDLHKKYYGLDITKTEPLKRFLWCYIPHFYSTPYYVYQYSTCFAISLALYQIYKKDKKEAIEKWKILLKAGGSMYPDEIVKSMGIDLSDPKTYSAVSDTLSEINKQLKTELNMK